MVTDEFTFPVITNNNVAVNLTVLPPLWRISSINNNNSADAELELQENGRKRTRIFRRSFIEIEAQIGKVEEEEEEEEEYDDVKAKAEEEKMDMLWEDFNDNLHLQLQGAVNSCSSTSSACSGYEFERNNNNNNYYNGEEFGSREESTDDIVHDHNTPTKKKNFEVVVVKMLKKLSLLQNMAKIKKRSPH
ncbi:hypothetical protein BUALT_Bualt04G0002400 [Buddleja alternifolia]|uniref:Uncharacterized protein n=1 Tax=Buddleja alternifolia TaxID=168488 RepID=A0AAV6XRY8_9LAMI|nr:hypothetical protein BUALT_Bualt04G0002400 [Buddleja alternifolia]